MLGCLSFNFRCGKLSLPQLINDCKMKPFDPGGNRFILAAFGISHTHGNLIPSLQFNSGACENFKSVDNLASEVDCVMSSAKGYFKVVGIQLKSLECNLSEVDYTLVYVLLAWSLIGMIGRILANCLPSKTEVTRLHCELSFDTLNLPSVNRSTALFGEELEVAIVVVEEVLLVKEASAKVLVSSKAVFSEAQMMSLLSPMGCFRNILSVLALISQTQGRPLNSAKPPSNFLHPYQETGHVESRSLTAVTEKPSNVIIRTTDSTDQSNTSNLRTAESADSVPAKLHTSSRFIDNSKIPPATIQEIVQTESQSNVRIRTDPANLATAESADGVHAKQHTSSPFIDKSQILPSTAQVTGVDAVHGGSYTDTIIGRQLQVLSTDYFDNDNNVEKQPSQGQEPNANSSLNNPTSDNSFNNQDPNAESPQNNAESDDPSINNIETHQFQAPPSIPSEQPQNRE